MCPDKDAGLFLGKLGAFEVTLASSLLPIGSHRGLLIFAGQLIDQTMFGRQHHVGGPKKGVWTRGENGKNIGTSCHLEMDFCPFGAANPIALHFLE